MQIFFGRIVTWLSAGVLTIWTAYKTFWIVGFIAFLAVALYSLFLYGVEDIFTTLLSKYANVNQPESTPAMSGFTGVAGWLLTCFKLPQCLAFIIDILLLKWTLRKIPFIKW